MLLAVAVLGPFMTTSGRSLERTAKGTRYHLFRMQDAPRLAIVLQGVAEAYLVPGGGWWERAGSVHFCFEVLWLCCSNVCHIQLLIAGCSAAGMQQLCTAPSELAPEPAVYTYARCRLYFSARLHNNNVFLTVVWRLGVRCRCVHVWHGQPGRPEGR